MHLYHYCYYHELAKVITSDRQAAVFIETGLSSLFMYASSDIYIIFWNIS